MKSLKTILTVNAVSSGLTGLLLFAFASAIAPIVGQLPTGAFMETGLFLVAFAGFVFYQSRQNPMSVSRIRFIIMLDCLWVVASLVLITTPSVELTGIGRIAIGVIAGWVALMAYLQTIGVRNVTA